MKQDHWYCWNHPDEYPYEVHFRTEKQNSEKMKFFRTLSEVRSWVRTHKTAHITYASWQVFELMREAVQP